LLKRAAGAAKVLSERPAGARDRVVPELLHPRHKVVVVGPFFHPPVAEAWAERAAPFGILHAVHARRRYGPNPAVKQSANGGHAVTLRVSL
jgi:hypothetical protein